MRTNRMKLIFLFISLIFIGACKEAVQISETNPNRVAYGKNVHEKTFGTYIVHINALTTDQLPAEVAQGYKIARSKSSAMLNVSIRQKNKSLGMDVPVIADIRVLAKNLTNQLKDLELREIRESRPTAIYYIGDVPVSNEETMVFYMDITPKGEEEKEPIMVSYRQQFFTQ